MITPRIGELTEKIDIINVTSPYDKIWTGTLVSYAARSLWAKVEPLAGGMTEVTQQEQVSTQPYNIWIRYRDGITAFQQIEYEGRRLVMTGPPEEIGNAWLLIHAEEAIGRTI